MWTKDEIKTIAKLWEEKSTNDLAEMIGVSRGRITYMAWIMRKAGFKLPRKRKNGELQSMLREVLHETKSR